MEQEPDEDQPAGHIPVMAQEALQFLDLRPGLVVVDATCGLLGHSRLMAKALQGKGRLIAIDRDPAILAMARDRIGEIEAGPQVLELVQASYVELEEVLGKLGVEAIDRILFDLGSNSVHFDMAERGFSFMADGPLSMLYDPESGDCDAAGLVNGLCESELADIFFKFGEERRAKRVARAICEARDRAPIRTTLELAEIVRRVVRRSHRDRLDPATRTFQALRVACNQELDHLARGLPKALALLKPGGIAVTIAFHSGEDRLCKLIMGKAAGRLTQIHEDPCPGIEFTGKYELIIKKPRRPGEDEMRVNPRSRSARLRAIRRVS